MKTFYRVYNDWNLSQRYSLKSFGIEVDEGFSSIDFSGTDENKELLQLIDEWALEKYYWTEYDKEDYLNSKLFVLSSRWANGYPMPDINGGYFAKTYQTDNNYCDACDIAKVQQDSFRLAKEPKWGNKTCFTMNWIYDELFVRKNLYDNVFKKIGLDFTPVVLFKKETVLEDTLQLKIPKVDMPLNLKNQPFELCAKCNRKKYRNSFKGLFPSFKGSIPNLPIFKTSDYFGSGAEAHNKIFITRELWDELKLLKVNINLIPVEP
ncbi:hypothetical protein [Pinibacter soli]|uniref:Uncharacterized protein n=1 Tax=Pinibacter soli TaxID=3044211 RepID=A0ABT6RDZ8_9BACT|nr:hypothetical protein [Pinibacter soli]MDI3320701.1 hypothetical protein [Pinibacter soli]